MKKVAVVGLWHLGCVISSVWSKLGYKVIGFDFDKINIDNLNNGESPIFEPGLDEAIKEGLKNNTLHFTNKSSDLNDCEYIFITYDTPVDKNDIPDTSILIKAINEIKNHLKNNCTIIVSSQTPIGFCKKLISLIKEVNKTVELVASPENLRLGEAINCYLNPGRIIIGSSNKKAEFDASNLFSKINAELIHMSIESAEMVKHGINSFLATSIIFANQLADICEIKNANIQDVIKGLKSDPRIGEKAYLLPSIGFSGGTLGRDLQVLRQVLIENKCTPNYFEIMHNFNNNRKDSIVKKVNKYIKGIRNKKIAVLGLTYKPGTSTLRRSLPLEIVNELFNEGAQIKVYDDLADYNELNLKDKNFEIAESVYELVENVDILILLTELKSLDQYNWSKIYELMKSPIIFDTKVCLNAIQLNEIGFKYLTIGNEN